MSETRTGTAADCIASAVVAAVVTLVVMWLLGVLK